MCNASNHPPGCTCGWGGDFHRGDSSGRNSYGGDFYRRDSYGGGSYQGGSGYYVATLFTTTNSYTTPNAKCPVCGDAVFFYSSANGSRVFFDELGPPWPKHPCTDNDYVISLEKQEPIGFIFNWQKKGWSPFIITHCRREQAYIYKITGKWQGSECVFYIEKKVDNEDFLEEVNDQCVAHIKKKGTSHQLSIANIYGDTITVETTEIVSEIENKLIRYLSSHVESERKKITGGRKVKTKQKKKQCKNKAMQLAFSKLKKK